MKRGNDSDPALIIYADWPYWRLEAPDRSVQEVRWYRHLAEAALPALIAIGEWGRTHLGTRIALAATPVWLRLLERVEGSRSFRQFLQQYRDAAYESAQPLSVKIAQQPQQAATHAQPETFARLQLSAQQADEIIAYWDDCGGSLTRRLRELCETGALLPVACPALQPQLAPLLAEESVYAQHMSAWRELARIAGSPPQGYWLPGGVRTAGAERFAAEVGVPCMYGEDAAAVARKGTNIRVPLVKLRNGSAAELVDKLCRAYPAEARAESADAPRLRSETVRRLRHLHEAERRWRLLLERTPALRDMSGQAELSAGDRMARQAARELLLLQSGIGEADGSWPDHLGCFAMLCDQIEGGAADEEWLARVEQADDAWLAVKVGDFAPRSSGVQAWIGATRGAVNIFMLAWEYPPKQVGGLACAVCDLAESLAQLGWTVHVVTCEHPGAQAFELLNGVHIHRVSVLRSGETDFFDWTFELNAAIVAYLVRWKELGGRIDLLHAHDWLVLQAARELKASYGVPLVATIHATESGRNRGSLHSELSHRIHGLEWELTYEAARVFVCSEFMREEVIRLFSLPRDKTAVFPNGVKVAADAPAVARPDERLEWAAPGEKIVLFIGRLVYEKGVQTLLAAMPRILERVPEAKLIIAGSGPMEAEARAIAAPLGGKVAFAGFADAKLKETLYGVADVVVVPSLYEPFGIVALEAMCRGKPLVVSDTGGLADIIEHGVDGYKALPGHVESLAWHTSELLLHSDAAARMIAAATAKLRKKYDCAHIAACIADVYRDLLQLDMPAEGSDFAQVSSSMAAAGI